MDVLSLTMVVFWTETQIGGLLDGRRRGWSVEGMDGWVLLITIRFSQKLYLFVLFS